MPKSRPSKKASLTEMAALSRRVAMAAPTPALTEARRIVARLEPEDRDITRVASIPEIVAIARAARKKGPVGRPSKKELFREARSLLDSDPDLEFPQIAKLLDPAGWARNPRKAGESIRQGILRLKHSR
jgi:hypothetical protein